MTYFKHFTACRDTTINPFYAKSYLANISYFLYYYCCPPPQPPTDRIICA